MTSVEYCAKCFGEAMLCDDCKNKIKEQWRSVLPERYRNVTLQNKHKFPEFIDAFINKDTKNSAYLIYGNMGTGKTQTLCAFANYVFDRIEIKSKTQRNPITWLYDQEFVSMVQWANAAKGNEPIHKVISDISDKSTKSILIIDDIGQGTARADVALAGYNFLVDQIYGKNGWLVMASNFKPSEMVNYIGYYALDRIVQMCGTKYMNEIKGESLRK